MNASFVRGGEAELVGAVGSPFMSQKMSVTFARPVRLAERGEASPRQTVGVLMRFGSKPLPTSNRAGGLDADPGERIRADEKHGARPSPGRSPGVVQRAGAVHLIVGVEPLQRLGLEIPPSRDMRRQAFRSGSSRTPRSRRVLHARMNVAMAANRFGNVRDIVVRSFASRS
jgi:hypothetical protein